MATFDLGKVVGDKGAKGDKGDKGDTGDTGATGNGISGIALISTSGKTKTYRISYTNGSHFDFNVVDGNDGSGDVVTSWESTLSDSKVPSEKLVKNSLDTKIGTSETAGLIKNDGTIDTTSYSTFSGSYSDLTNKPSIPSKTSDLTNDGDGTNVFVKNNDSRLSDSRTPTAHTHTKSQITDFPSIPSKISDLTNDSDFIETSETAGLVKNDGTIDTTSYSTFSGSYTDLSNKPSIPSSSSDLSDGSSLVKTSSTTGLLKNDGSVMTSGTGSSNWAVGNHTHSGYVSATKVTSWSSTVSDSNVPSEKLVKDSLDSINALIGDAIDYINS